MSQIDYTPGSDTHDEQHLRLHETPTCTGRWAIGAFAGTPVVLCMRCKRDWALDSAYGRLALHEVKLTQCIKNELRKPLTT